MTHTQVPPLKAILDNEGLNQWCVLFAFWLFSPCVMARSFCCGDESTCLTIGFQLVPVYSAVLNNEFICGLFLY